MLKLICRNSKANTLGDNSKDVETERNTVPYILFVLDAKFTPCRIPISKIASIGFHNWPKKRGEEESNDNH